MSFTWFAPFTFIPFISYRRHWSQQDTATSDTALLGECLVLVGLSRTAAHRADSVDYLQQAVRLCTPGNHATRALVNLGAAHFRLRFDGSPGKVSAGEGTAANGSSSILSAREEAEVKEASLYWQEALEPGAVAVNADGSPEAPPGTGSGCGPNWASKSTTADASSSSSAGDTGGDGTAEAAASGDNSPEHRVAALEALLLKASALASLGEAQLARLPPPVAAIENTGGVDESADPQREAAAATAAKAEEEAESRLVGCLDTLRDFESSCETLISEAKPLAVEELFAVVSAAAGIIGGAAPGSGAHVRAMKGRALRGLGMLSHRRGDPVSSEGFYRAALAEFALPSAASEFASASVAEGAPTEVGDASEVPAEEVTRCMADLASLLSDWDGRASEAAMWAQRANDAEAQTPELCGMFVLPTLAELALELEK